MSTKRGKDKSKTEATSTLDYSSGPRKSSSDYAGFASSSKTSSSGLPTPASTSRRSSVPSSQNPAVRQDSGSIEALSEDLSLRIGELVQEGKSFEDIFLYCAERKKVTLELAVKWLNKFDEFRRKLAISTFPEEYTKDDPLDAVRLKFAEDTIEDFISRISKKHDWTSLGSHTNKDVESIPEIDEASSDEEQPNEPDSSGKPEESRRLSWKEFKKRKQIDEMLGRKVKSLGIKKLFKLTVKDLFKQKKKANEKAKSIEVDKEDVADMIYEVTDHMAKVYLPRIQKLVMELDPAADASGSECESGSYDSEECFYEHKEDKRSKLSKMVMSVRPELLVAEGLYKMLLVTLPLCSDYTDEAQLYEYLDILKETKEMGPEMYLVGSSGPVEQLEDRKGISGHTKTVVAHIEPSASNETLAGMTDIDLRKESIHEDTVEKGISERLKRRSLKSFSSEDSQSFLKSTESEDSQSLPFIDDSIEVFPNVGSVEQEAALASPEDISDIQLSEPSEGDLPPEQAASPVPSALHRSGSRRRTDNSGQSDDSPAKRSR